MTETPDPLPPTIQALGDPRGKQATWTLLPVDTSDGRCSQCAVQHDPGMPHDRNSLAYQYSFYAEHNHWPTWADAMAHCDAATRQLWRTALGARGFELGEQP